MGFYINTGGMKDKAEWIKLNLNGIRLTGKPTHVGEEFVPVCVVDNGEFEAAGIAFNKDAADAFEGKGDKKDKRKKEWLLIKVEDAIACCPSVAKHIKWRDV